MGSETPTSLSRRRVAKEPFQFGEAHAAAAKDPFWFGEAKTGVVDEKPGRKSPVEWKEKTPLDQNQDTPERANKKRRGLREDPRAMPDPLGLDNPPVERFEEHCDPASMETTTEGARLKEENVREEAQREVEYDAQVAEDEDDEETRDEDEGDAEEEEEEEDEEEEEEPAESETDDEDEPIDLTVQQDMEKLNRTFPEQFKDNYRLIKRIGEGTFSTVYKAEDLRYDRYNNSWDLDAKDEQWERPPPKSASQTRAAQRRPRKFVAIKKIYVTSSPTRIFNELDLLYDLRDSHSVCPLITAFRHADQVLAILPYFRHQDFRRYYTNMTVPDIRLYFRSLFTALAAVHDKGILHRDIKPTNFLYDPDKQRGVLVDFGLAEREGVDHKPCLCHLDAEARRQRIRAANPPPPWGTQHGYPKNDTRPSRRANRAGTRGFRAPEVLFKCTEQTTKIDVWSAGVILLTILCKRFPFFNSADDVEAMIEIATIFGVKRMQKAGQLHGCVFDTNIPTIGGAGFTFEKIMLWSTCRSDGSSGSGRGGSTGSGGGPDNNDRATPDERAALEFLGRCMDLEPSRRISAREALEHPFLRLPADTDDAEEDEPDEDDVVMV